MRFPALLLPATLGLIAVSGCDRQDKGVTAEPAARPSASASAAPSAPAEPQGCKASGSEPAKLGTSVGVVFGMIADATSLYFITWDAYGSRGTLGTARKDGGGAKTLSSMELEPRGLAADTKRIFFTSGIRLMGFWKDGDSASVLVPIFSSQRIALDAEHVYGVPADYGPYDRVAVVPKKGGGVSEIATAKRPDSKESPNGYSSIAVDDSGIYVADSGHDRLVDFPFKDGKVEAMRTVVAHQPRVENLLIDGSRLVFTVGLQGDLMSVEKSGGKAQKLGSGLAKHAPIAMDKKSIVTTLAGKDDDAPHTLATIPAEGGAPKPLPSVDAASSVEAVALDADCVYWVEREPIKSTLAVYARRR
jgi:hypothetical protein